MSLLLDALKKAADEKEKLKDAESENNHNNSDKTQANDSEDMDLDLEIKDQEDIFPQVDEKLIKIEEVEENSYDESSEFNQHEKQQEDEYKDKAEGTEIVISNDVVEITGITKIEPEPEPEEKYTVNNKEALTELINKSNEQTKIKKIKVRLAIISIISFILIIVTSYLYFEFSSNSQNLFVADSAFTMNKVRAVKSSIKQEKLVNNIKKIIEVKQPIEKKLVIDKPALKHVVKTVKTPVKPSAIKLIHKTIKDPTDEIVRSAYDAFKIGDYVLSKRLYEKAYKNESNNRDVLLGLAAIAVKEQRYEYARQKYLQLRYLNPKDSIAIAGLSAIKNEKQSQLGESKIKFMLQEQPGAAHLYFALGSIYASQQQWPKAQSAFFSAWSGNNSHADYAYNLAVSLDHLGKKKQAIKYYRICLSDTEEGTGSFSKQDVEIRLNILNQTRKKYE